MNKLYKEFYKQKLFSLKEANKIIKNYQVCKNTIQRLLFKGMIKAIKPGLYYIVPLDNEDFYPDKIHIASYLRNKGVLACNSALIAYKFLKEEPVLCLFSQYNSKQRIKNTTYKILKNKSTFGIIEYEYITPYTTIKIKMTDFERTILDCLRTKLIKIEELIRILKSSRIKIDMNKIITYLEKFRMPILYNKTGFVLEQAETSLMIMDEDLDKIKKKLSKKIFYAKEKGIKLVKPKYKYNKQWNIMIPEELTKITSHHPVSAQE